MDVVKELVKEIKIELIEKGKNLDQEQVSSFYKWMKVEYKNYMMLNKETCLTTLNKLKTAYDIYAPMVEVLEKRMDEYGSTQGFYRASLELTNVL